MREFFQAQGVPQQTAPDFEGAPGEIKARGVQGPDLLAGQCVDGGEGAVEAADGPGAHGVLPSYSPAASTARMVL
ncbi:hypothetical protein [Streptomyces sp. NBC_01538]|uniref:hypothetical protein n=1 Tax=Streptomyces sp. NBC_01538 TaxID=2903897 RepID=UPI0038686AE3